VFMNIAVFDFEETFTQIAQASCCMVFFRS